MKTKIAIFILIVLNALSFSQTITADNFVINPGGFLYLDNTEDKKVGFNGVYSGMFVNSDLWLMTTGDYQTASLYSYGLNSAISIGTSNTNSPVNITTNGSSSDILIANIQSGSTTISFGSNASDKFTVSQQGSPIFSVNSGYITIEGNTPLEFKSPSLFSTGTFTDYKYLKIKDENGDIVYLKVYREVESGLTK